MKWKVGMRVRCVKRWDYAHIGQVYTVKTIKKEAEYFPDELYVHMVDQTSVFGATSSVGKDYFVRVCSTCDKEDCVTLEVNDG